MPTSQELKVTERDTTVTPRQLRAAGFIPATIYGKGRGTQAIQVRMHEFSQHFMQGVRTFNLTGFTEGTVKAHQVHRHQVSQAPISIEFMWVEAGQENAKQSKSKSEKKTEEQSTPAAPEAETALSGV